MVDFGLLGPTLNHRFLSLVRCRYHKCPVVADQAQVGGSTFSLEIIEVGGSLNPLVILIYHKSHKFQSWNSVNCGPQGLNSVRVTIEFGMLNYHNYSVLVAQVDSGNFSFYRATRFLSHAEILNLNCSARLWPGPLQLYVVSVGPYCTWLSQAIYWYFSNCIILYVQAAHPSSFPTHDFQK